MAIPKGIPESSGLGYVVTLKVIKPYRHYWWKINHKINNPNKKQNHTYHISLFYDDCVIQMFIIYWEIIVKLTAVIPLNPRSTRLVWFRRLWGNSMEKPLAQSWYYNHWGKIFKVHRCLVPQLLDWTFLKYVGNLRGCGKISYSKPFGFKQTILTRNLCFFGGHHLVQRMWKIRLFGIPWAIVLPPCCWGINNGNDKGS